MEAADAGAFASDGEFLELLYRARQKDTEAMLELLRRFEPEAAALVRNIPMAREDAMQSLRLAMLELFTREDQPPAAADPQVRRREDVTRAAAAPHGCPAPGAGHPRV